MSASKPRELGTGVAVGLVVGGLVATVLSIGDLPFSAPVGAFVAGALAAYVVYDKIGPATLAGTLAGLLSLPFFLGLSQILVIFELIPIPPGPQPTMAELQSAVVAITLMDILAGAVAGSLLGAVRHPPAAPSTTTLPNYPAGQAKYCVQCGAQLPTGTRACPHCGAQHPESVL
jgi:hypothetical protein